MTDANAPSTEYQRGLTDGGAQKWRTIRSMWGGLGIFIIVMLLIVAPNLYRLYNGHQIESEKVKACAHATDVTACLTAIGK